MSVLTRAARRKANLSPPPSFFPDSKQIFPSANKVSHFSTETAAKLSARNVDSSSDAVEEGDCNLWVQCDHCHKWRLLPRSESIESHEMWNCSLHPDLSKRSCVHPQEHCKREQYVFSQLEVGQLVWAKMIGFCPWPAIITPDWWGEDQMSKDGSSIYHVEFLGRPRTHTWLAEDKVEPFNRSECSLGSIALKSKKFEVAMKEANCLCQLPKDKLLKSCVFTNKIHLEAPKTIKQTKHVSEVRKCLLKEKVPKKKIPSTLQTCVLDDEVNVEKMLAILFPNVPLNQLIKPNYNKNTVATYMKTPTSSTGKGKESLKRNQSDMVKPASVKKMKINRGKQKIVNTKDQCKLEFVSRKKLKKPAATKNNATQDRSKTGNELQKSPTSKISTQQSAMDDIVEAEEEAQKELQMIENMLGLVEDDQETQNTWKEEQTSMGTEKECGDQQLPVGEQSKAESATDMSEGNIKEDSTEVAEDTWICNLLDSIDTLDGQIQDFSS